MGMKGIWARAATALCAAALLAGTGWAADKPGPYHEDEAWGYRLRVPRDWTHAAMSASEQWIASKHVRDRPLSAPVTLGTGGGSVGDTPELWVIGFPHERREQRGAKREKVGDGGFKITIENPYRSYKDFIKRESWATQGGYYYSKEEEDEENDLSVTKYEIKVEKMVMAPMRIVTWVYHCEDVDFAVQFKIFEHHYDDWQRTIEACLGSFRQIERTQAMREPVTTGESIVDVEAEKDLTPEERARRREQKVNAHIEREIAALPDDWLLERSDHYVAFSHADKKFTERTLAHAEAVRGYLDETFEGLGDDYIPVGIIRIFANTAEENAFRQGTANIWMSDVQPVLLTQKVGAEQDWEYEHLGAAITNQWLRFKNRSLADGMPAWIRQGLLQHIRFAKPKGRRRLEFKPDPYDTQELRELVKDEKVMPLEKLLAGSTDTTAANGPGFVFTTRAFDLQAGSVVTFLLEEYNRGDVEGALTKYLQTLIEAIEEEDRKFEEALAKRRVKVLERDNADGDGGLTEEEEEELEEWEEEMWKDFKDRLEERFETIRTRSFEAAFGHLDERDWKQLERRWQRFAG